MKFSLFSLSLTSCKKVFSDIFIFFFSFHFAPVRRLSASSLTRTLFTYFSEPGVIARTLAANSTQDDLVLIPPIKVERFHQFCLSISRDLNPDGSTSVISIFLLNLLLRMLIEWHLRLILSLFWLCFTRFHLYCLLVSRIVKGDCWVRVIFISFLSRTFTEKKT